MSEIYPFPLPENHSEMMPGQLFRAAMKIGLGKNSKRSQPAPEWTDEELATEINNRRRDTSQTIAVGTIRNWKNNGVPKKYRYEFFSVLMPTHRMESTKLWAVAFRDCWARRGINHDDIKNASFIEPKYVDIVPSKIELIEILREIAEEHLQLGEVQNLLSVSKDVLKNALPIKLANQHSHKSEEQQQIAHQLLFNTMRLTIACLLLDRSKSDILTLNVFHEIDWFEVHCLAVGKRAIINSKNLSQPINHPMVRDIAALCAKFSNEIGTISDEDIGTCLRHSYWAEWRRDQGTYNSAFECIFVNSPKMKADIAFHLHHSWLKSEVQSPLFSNDFGQGGEPFSISDIFVDLPLTPEGLSGSQVDLKAQIKSRVFSSKLIKKHIEKHNHSEPGHRFLIIRGGPGSGKSSILKFFAAKNETAADDNRCAIVYVPLQRHGPFSSSDQTLKLRGQVPAGFSFDPDGIDLLGLYRSSNFEKLIVILDGLDELGDTESQRDQVNAISRTLDIIDNSRDFDGVGFIIAGRDQAFQNLAHQKNQNQFTYRLNALAVEDPEERTLVPHIEPNKEEYIYNLRPKWVENYCRFKFTDQSVIKVNAEQLLSSFTGLDELTREPLLLYLITRVAVDIANSNKGVSFDLGRVFDVSKSNSLNKSDIYDLLIDSIRYPKHRLPTRNERPFDDGGLPETHFRDVLACLAIAAWRNGTGRRATVQEFLTVAKERNLENQARRFISHSKSDEIGNSGLSLLSVFYYQSFKSDIDLHDEFEFTHKSFASFLVATTLFDQAIELAVVARDSGAESAKMPLKKWTNLIGLGVETDEIFRFLREEARRYYRKTNVSLESVGRIGELTKKRLERRDRTVQWADMEKIISYAHQLGYEPPNSYVQTASHHSSALTLQMRALRFLFGIWGALVGTKQVLATESYRPSGMQIDEAMRISLTSPLSDQTDITNSHEITVNYVSRSLAGLDFEESDFSSLNLIGADFANSKIERTHFEATVAVLAEFELTSMDGLEIQTSNLNSARFFRTGEFSMFHSVVRDALIENCSFTGRKFISCDLSSTEILNSTFANCTFKMTRFDFVVLQQCKFRSCQFELCDFDDLENDGTTFSDCLFNDCQNQKFLMI